MDRRPVQCAADHARAHAAPYKIRPDWPPAFLEFEQGSMEVVSRLEGLLRLTDELLSQQQHAAHKEASEASNLLVRRCAEAEAARAVLQAQLASAEQRASEAEAAAAAVTRELFAMRARCEAAEGRVGITEQHQSRPRVTHLTAVRDLEVRNFPVMEAAEIRVLFEHFGALSSLQISPDPEYSAATLIVRVRFQQQRAAAAAADRLHEMELRQRRLQTRLIELA